MFCFLLPTLAFAKEVRLALIVESPASQPAADLLAAELSSTTNLLLVERTEIDRIVREQQLVAGNVKDSLKLGQILGADGLLILNTGQENERSFLYARLIAVKPGVVLRTAAYQWPLDNLSEWPKVAAHQFEPLLPKLDVLLKDAVPVSILNLRSGVKSSGAEQIEKELTLLLIDRLSRAKEVFVLERQRMAMLESEKELKAMEDSPFWNGSYLLEGIIDKEGFSPEAVSVSARLVTPDKKSETIELTGRRNDLPAVAEALAKQVLARFKNITAGIAWNPASEALEYLEEARWAMRWRLYSQAQWASDSAWALGSHELETARLRVQSYAHAGIIRSNFCAIDQYSMTVSEVDGVYPQSLEALAIALEYFVNSHAYLGTNATDKTWSDTGVGALGTAMQHLWRYWYTPKAIPAASESLARLREAARNTERVLLPTEELPTPAIYESAAGKRIWDLKLKWGWLYAESPREVFDDYRRLLSLGLSGAQRRELRERGPTSPRAIAWTAQERAEIPQLWEEFLQEQISSTNLLVSLEGRMWRYRGTPLSELAAGAEADYSHPAGPIFEALEQHKGELLCRSNKLVLEALAVTDCRGIPRWQPRGTPKLDIARHFRTNFFQYWVEHGDCFDAQLAQLVFNVNDYTTNQLAGWLQKIGARNQGGNQLANWRKAGLRASLANVSRTKDGTAGSVDPRYYRDEILQMLFQVEDYDRAEGERLLIELRNFGFNLNLLPALAKYLSALEQHLAKLAEAPTKTTAMPPMPAHVTAKTNMEPLLLTHWWEACTNRTKSSYTSDISLLHVRYREQRLWFQAQFVYHWLVTNDYDNVSLKGKVIGSIFNVDLKDFSYTQQPYGAEGSFRTPLSWSELPRNFEVLNNFVYRSQDNNLWRAAAGDTNWHELNVPLPGQMVPFKVKDRIYLVSSDTILEFEPNRGATRVLASTRRRPPVHELDQFGSFQKAFLFDGGSNKVQLFFRDTVRSWGLRPGEWGSASPPLLSALPSIAYADESQILLSAAEMGPVPNPVRVLYRLVKDHPPEALFPLQPQSPSVFPGRAAPKLPPTRWKPPGPPQAGNGIAAPVGESVWWLRYSSLRDKPFLLYFDKRFSEPFFIPLKFSGTAPFPGAIGPGPIPKLELLPVAEGLILFPRLCPGFWFIPKGELETWLAAAYPESFGDKSAVSTSHEEHLK